MPGKKLVGAATRYIAGRNAVQTTYWRKSTAEQPKFMKVSRTVRFEKNVANEPPKHIQEQQNIRV